MIKCLRISGGTLWQWEKNAGMVFIFPEHQAMIGFRLRGEGARPVLTGSFFMPLLCRGTLYGDPQARAASGHAVFLT